MESNDGLVSAKAMAPLSKLLLLTSIGKKKGLKSKTIRTLGFISSMTNKVREKMKL